jgi:hypothetical protein
MSDTIRQVRKQLEARLAELQPMVDEYEELSAMLAAIDRTTGQTSPAATKARKPLAVRRAEILEYIERSPGCRVADIARWQGITGARATQIISGLEQMGAVDKTTDGLRLGSADAVSRALQVRGDQT